MSRGGTSLACSLKSIDSRTGVNLEKPQAPNSRVVRPRLTINEEQHVRVKGPVLGPAPRGIGYCAKVNQGGRVEGIWLVQRFVAPRKRDRIVVSFGGDGRRDVENRRLVGNLILEGDV